MPAPELLPLALAVGGPLVLAGVPLWLWVMRSARAAAPGGLSEEPAPSGAPEA